MFLSLFIVGINRKVGLGDSSLTVDDLHQQVQLLSFTHPSESLFIERRLLF